MTKKMPLQTLYFNKLYNFRDVGWTYFFVIRLHQSSFLDRISQVSSLTAPSSTDQLTFIST